MVFDLNSVPLCILYALLDLDSKMNLRQSSKSIFQVFDPIFSAQIQWRKCPRVKSSIKYVQRARFDMETLNQTFFPHLKYLQCILSIKKNHLFPNNLLLQYENITFLHLLHPTYDKTGPVFSLKFNVLLPPNLISLKIDDAILLGSEVLDHWPQTIQEVSIYGTSTYHHQPIQEEYVKHPITFPHHITTLSIKFLFNVVKWPHDLRNLRIENLLCGREKSTCELPVSLQTLYIGSNFLPEDEDLGLSCLTRLEILHLPGLSNPRRFTDSSKAFMIRHLSCLHTLRLPKACLNVEIDWPPALTYLELLGIHEDYFTCLPPFLKHLQLLYLDFSIKHLASTLSLPFSLTSLHVENFFNPRAKNSLIHLKHLKHLRLPKFDGGLLLPLSLKEIMIGPERMHLIPTNYPRSETLQIQNCLQMVQTKD